MKGIKELVNEIKENVSPIGIVLGYIVVPVLIGISLSISVCAVLQVGWIGALFFIAPICEFVATYWFIWRHLADNLDE